MSDLIDRQQAIDALHMHLMYRMGTDSNKKRLDDWINGLPSAEPESCKYWDAESNFCALSRPSAQPERKKGMWVPHRERSREYIGTALVSINYDYWFCDTCGYRVEDGQPMYNFCPNCGAKMEKEEADETD